jgi:hypothetical protein
MVEDTDNTAWVPGRVERQACEAAPAGTARCDRLARLIGRFAVLVLVLAIALVCLASAVDWLAHHDMGSASRPLPLLTLCAGLFAAGALLGVAEVTLSRRPLKLTEQGRVADRYAKAVSQLGSDQLDVRIGGICALERVSRDSARHRAAVMEVLTAFIRECSHKPLRPPDPARREDKPSARPDVQAALTVLGRRSQERNSRPIDLTGADLTGADLRGANLTRARLFCARLFCARLTGADLSRANLHGADLTGADLTRATLTGADLTRACLFCVRLTRATLTRADFTCADLTSADLYGAHLTGADLTRAVLYRADLTRARVFRAHLADADLMDARWPEHAAVPGGWSVDAGTGRVAEAAAGFGPAEAI